MKLTNAQLEKLVSEEVSNEALKLALEKHKQQQAEREAAAAMRFLEQYEVLKNAQVNAIRLARKQEAAAKQALSALDDAFEAFKKGDLDPLKKLGVR